MRTCDCGGEMVRNAFVQLKLTKEWKVRMICKECKKAKNHYFADKPEFKAIRRTGEKHGRPFYVLA